MVQTVKFSDFINGGVLNDSDIVVGLQAGANAQFTSNNPLGAWTVVTTDTVMVSNNGYIVDSVSPITLTLPHASNVGDQIAISSLGTGGWIINQTAGQSITITISSTVGVGGSVFSSSATDSIRLVCNVANLGWTTSGGPQGNILVI